jgi:hypothetical protein
VHTLGCVQVDERAGPWGPMLRHGFNMCERVNARNVSETRPHTATWTDAHSLALHSTVYGASRNANAQCLGRPIRQLQHMQMCVGLSIKSNMALLLLKCHRSKYKPVRFTRA